MISAVKTRAPVIGGMSSDSFSSFSKPPYPKLSLQPLLRFHAVHGPCVNVGSFAAWGVTFGAVDCAMIGLRGKEDPWNAIISGAATGMTGA